MAMYEEIRQELKITLEEYKEAKKELKDFKEGWKENKIWELEKKLDDGKERNEEQRKGWESQKDRLIKEKEELKAKENDRWQRYGKLQDDLVDLAKGGGNELIA